MRGCNVLAVLLLGQAAAWAHSNKDVPSWVEEMASRKLPAYSGKVPAAVLINDQHVTFDAGGAMTVTERHAIKILNQQGKQEARVAVHYWKNRRDVKDLHAWLIAPNGFQKTFEKGDVVDIGDYSQDELYMDGRMRAISAGSPEVGSVFAYEYTVQEKVFIAQDQYVFQDDRPALQSRYVLTLPTGWTPKAVMVNHAPVEPIVEGSTYTWELKDLGYREAEDESAHTYPRLTVSFIPPAGASASVPVVTSWNEAARLQYSLVDGLDEVTPEISSKVAQLTAGAKTDYEKLCAIGHYVQNIRYVAIEMDLQNGGGYTPHSADVVFNKQYGDCKDKANLMRCMLKAAGLPSYLVAIYAGDRTWVKQEWPSPEQFNHMILAAKVTQSPADSPTIETPLGKLLIFDPTNEKTPVGDLPSYLQGSYAMVIDNARGDLFKMPVTKPEKNMIEVTVEATLNPAGSLTASYVASKLGQPASYERYRHDREKADEYKEGYQRFLNEEAKGAVISQFNPQDSFNQNKFDLKIDFSSPSYGQLMQQRLLVFSPAVVPLVRSVAPYFPKQAQRASPVVLDSSCYRKTVRLKLPDGFALDEQPVPAHYKTDYATFNVSFKQEGTTLIMTEELRTEAATLPADQFASVKEFYDKCHGADLQKVVLAKQ